MKRIIQVLVAMVAVATTLLVATPAQAGIYSNSTMYRRTAHVVMTQNAYTAKWAWPTQRAIWKYNDHPSINMYTVKDCAANTHPCIVIIPYYSATDNYYGYSRTFWVEGKGVTFGMVYLNTAKASTQRQMQAVACHEIGHITGLAHDPNRVSCIGKGDSYGPYPYPSSYDNWVIKYKYDYEKRPW